MVKQKFNLKKIEHSILILDKLDDKLKKLEATEDTRLSIRLALLETLGNAFQHGQKEGFCPVELSWYLRAGYLKFKVRDSGTGFNHRNISLQCSSKEILKEEGKGLILIHKVLDEVWFNEKGNEINGVKRW